MQGRGEEKRRDVGKGGRLWGRATGREKGKGRGEGGKRRGKPSIPPVRYLCFSRGPLNLPKKVTTKLCG